MSAKIAVIVQCRLSSERLPGKALKKLGGQTLLEWTLSAMRRVPACRYFVATDYDSLPVLEPLAAAAGWEIAAGPLDDVLRRFCMVVGRTDCDAVLRATADNPFLFYEAAALLCDEFAERAASSRLDYMTLTGLPHGSGTEIFRAQALLEADSVSRSAFEREHVGPAVYNHKERFASLFEKAPARFFHPEYRTTVDTSADYLRALAVVQNLSGGKAPDAPYTAEEILSALRNPDVYDTVLFVPSVKKGHGTGHLRRCLSAAEAGGFVYIPEDADPDGVRPLVAEAVRRGLDESRIVRRFPERGEYSLIAADCFRMDGELSRRLYEAAPVAAIDEGSAFTRRCDYLLDILPSADLRRRPNLADSAFLEKPVRRKPSARSADGGAGGNDAREIGADGTRVPIRNALVCVGGEDPADLTAPAARAFAACGLAVTAVLPEYKLPRGSAPQAAHDGGPDTRDGGDVCESGAGGQNDGGPVSAEADSGGAGNPAAPACDGGDAHENGADGNGIAPAGGDAAPARKAGRAGAVRYTAPVPNLRERLADYDLVVTHYGLTAFEAVSAGCAVVLLATSGLHDRLAEKYGFVCLKKRDLRSGSVRKLLARPEKLYPASPVSAETRALWPFLKTLSHGRRLCCPVCRTFRPEPDEVVARTPRRTFRKCAECGILYIAWTSDCAEQSYGTAYFHEQYQAQYGKTYLEDFDSIKKTGLRRIAEIGAALKSDGRASPSLLDIGCAYGPFLAAAAERGWQPFGVDVAEDAIRYVQEKLLIPAARARFPDLDAAAEFGVNRFDAVSMWFVIEHFSDLRSALTAVSGLVRDGGVFAFSTPSGEGVSARTNREAFFRDSPSDHYTVWSPSGAARILKKFGFSVVKIVSTGHHPERFPSVRKNGLVADSPAGAAAARLSRALRLGDTFEVYCRKDRAPEVGERGE